MNPLDWITDWIDEYTEHLDGPQIWRRIIFATALAWLAIGLTVGAAFGKPILITNDGGGQIGEYQIRAEIAKAQNPNGFAAKIDGTCESACAVFLRDGCVTPSAILGFHSPTAPTNKRVENARRVLAGYMPPAMAKWYLDGPANYAPMTYLTYRQAILLGAKPCK